MDSNTLIDSCNYHYNQDIEHFPEKLLYSVPLSSHPPLPLRLMPDNHLPVLYQYSFVFLRIIIHINGIIQHVTF